MNSPPSASIGLYGYNFSIKEIIFSFPNRCHYAKPFLLKGFSNYSFFRVLGKRFLIEFPKTFEDEAIPHVLLHHLYATNN